MNSIMTEQTSFDYGLVSGDQAMALKEISIRLGVRVQRTAEEMLAMGADLIEAKKVCREDGKLFGQWCQSGECPVGLDTAQRLISVSRRLPENRRAAVFDHGFCVLAEVTQTREEDIRAALLEHVEKEAEDGHKITQKEITALKKALKDERARSERIEDSAFDAKIALQAAIEARKKAERIADEKEAAVKRATENAIETDRLKRKAIADMEAEQKRLKQELDDAEEVYRDQLEEMRKRIVKEERSRPRTDEEKKARAAELKKLKDEFYAIKIETADAIKERDATLEKLYEAGKEVMLRDKLLGHFQTASAALEKDLAMFVSSASALRQIPMTDELYKQIHTMIDLMQTALNKLEEVTNVTR